MLDKAGNKQLMKYLDWSMEISSGLLQIQWNEHYQSVDEKNYKCSGDNVENYKNG